MYVLSYIGMYILHGCVHGQHRPTKFGVPPTPRYVLASNPDMGIG